MKKSTGKKRRAKNADNVMGQLLGSAISAHGRGCKIPCVCNMNQSAEVHHGDTETRSTGEEVHATSGLANRRLPLKQAGLPPILILREHLAGSTIHPARATCLSSVSPCLRGLIRRVSVVKSAVELLSGTRRAAVSVARVRGRRAPRRWACPSRGRAPCSTWRSIGSTGWG